MALSEAKRRSNDKYIASHYSQVKLSMPNAEAEALSEYCGRYGLTKAGTSKKISRFLEKLK